VRLTKNCANCAYCEHFGCNRPKGTACGIDVEHWKPKKERDAVGKKKAKKGKLPLPRLVLDEDEEQIILYYLDCDRTESPACMCTISEVSEVPDSDDKKELLRLAKHLNVPAFMELKQQSQVFWPVKK
jgi:hypothetical protein